MVTSKHDQIANCQRLLQHTIELLIKVKRYVFQNVLKRVRKSGLQKGRYT